MFPGVVNDTWILNNLNYEDGKSQTKHDANILMYMFCAARQYYYHASFLFPSRRQLLTTIWNQLNFFRYCYLYIECVIIVYPWFVLHILHIHTWHGSQRITHWRLPLKVSFLNFYCVKVYLQFTFILHWRNVRWW